MAQEDPIYAEALAALNAFHEACDKLGVVAVAAMRLPSGKFFLNSGTYSEGLDLLGHMSRGIDPHNDQIGVRIVRE